MKIGSREEKRDPGTGMEGFEGKGEKVLGRGSGPWVRKGGKDL